MKPSALFLLASAFSLLCLSGASPLLAQTINSKNVAVYRDEATGFVLTYPDDWSQVPSTHQKTRIKIVSNRGNGLEDCSVNVQIVEGANSLTPQESASQFLDGPTYQQMLRKSLPDLVVEKSGRTFISNQDAAYYQSRFTFRSVGIEVPMKMMQIQIASKGKIFTVSCRAGAAEFEKKLPKFQLVFAGFLIKQ